MLSRRTTKLMPHSLTRSQVRDFDAQAIADYGLPGIVLMENAGRGAADVLVGLGIHGPVVVCAGKGNNGGDGFVIARHLEGHGFDARVLLFANPDELAGDAAVNWHILERGATPRRVLGRQPAWADVERELSEADWI